MFRHRSLSELGAAVWRMIRAEFGVIVAIGLLCLLAGWHSADQIGQALGIAGVLIFVIGSVGSLAGRSDPHCIEHQEVQRTIRAPDPDRLEGPGRGLDAPQFFQGAMLGGLTLGIALLISVL